MSSPAKHWILKVVSGPHQGAEIRLPQGRSLVGSDEECDVVLHDVLVAPQHFSFELSNDSIKVTPLGGRLYCDGAWMKDSEVTVKPFSFLTAGGTHLIIGPSDKAWPSLSFSDIPQIIKGPEESAGEPRSVSGEGTENEEQRDEHESGISDEAIGAGSEADEGSPPIEGDDKRRRRALIGIGLGVFLLVIWMVLVKQLRPGDEQEPAEDSAKIQQIESVEEKKSRVEEFIVNMGLGGNLVVTRRGDILEVEGYVQSDEQLVIFRESVGENFKAVFPRIRSLEMIEASANAIISDHGLGLLAEVDSDGTIEVSGVILPDSEEKWRLAQSQLESIPGVKNGNLKTDVKIAAPKPLASPSPELLSISGPSDGSGSVGELRAAGSVVARGEEEEAASEDAGSLVEVIGIREDGLNWVRMRNGDVFFSGAGIPSGGVIEQILPEELVIRDNGIQQRVKKGGNAW
jgi:hypothetical protein